MTRHTRGELAPRPAITTLYYSNHVHNSGNVIIIAISQHDSPYHSFILFVRVQSGSVRRLAKKRNMPGKRSGPLQLHNYIMPFFLDCGGALADATCLGSFIRSRNNSRLFVRRAKRRQRRRSRLHAKIVIMRQVLAARRTSRIDMPLQAETIEMVMYTPQPRRKLN